MKKTIKMLTAVMAVLTLCLGLLAGCAASSPVGTWKLASAESGGVKVDASELDMDADSIMIINQDGTVTTDGEPSGEWTVDGDVLTISNSGVSIDFEYTGSEIILDLEFAKVTFARV